MGRREDLLSNRGPKPTRRKECDLPLSRIFAEPLRITDERLVDYLQTAALGIPDSRSRKRLFILPFYSHWFAHLEFYYSVSAGRYRLTLGSFGRAPDILFEIRPGLVDKYWTNVCVCVLAPASRVRTGPPLDAHLPAPLCCPSP